MKKSKRSVYLKIKRYIDCFLAVWAILLIWPLFLAICVAIKLDSKGSVFFTQKRVGFAGRLFDIYKFRTMYEYAPKDVPTHMLDDPEEYITGVGAFLRKYGLDELPQLLNIIKGDMSFVGPRPALWNQYDLIRERAKHGANRVPPGLTGLAQINGRDELNVSEKAAWDGVYARDFGLLIDLKCFFGTFSTLFSADGVKKGGTGER